MKATFNEVLLFDPEIRTSQQGREFLKSSFLVKTDKKQATGQFETIDRFYINILAFGESEIETIRKHSIETNAKSIYTISGKLTSEIYDGVRRFTLFLDSIEFIKELESSKNNPRRESSLQHTSARDSKTDYNPYENNPNPFKE